MSNIKKFLEALIRDIGEVETDKLSLVSQTLSNTISQGSSIYIIANGGSAAIASHVMVDLVKNFGANVRFLSDPAFLTCYSNDFGYEYVYSTYFRQFLRKGDLVVAISSSGESENIINGANEALAMDAQLVTLSGFRKDNRLRGCGGMSFYINSTNYNTVETMHQIILLALVEELFGMARSVN